MAIDWNNIPTTSPTSNDFGNLQPNTRYNLQFAVEKNHKVFTPDNSKVASGSLIVLKLKTINGDTGVGSNVQAMLNFDPDDAKWFATQQAAVIKIGEAAGLNRVNFPTEANELVAYLLKELSGKIISGELKEGNPYNGNRQWELSVWTAETPASTFNKTVEGDLIDQNPDQVEASVPAPEFDV